MTWVATAIIGSAVVGGAVASSSASKAAKAQKQSADRVSDASEYAADLSYQLGNDELDFTKRQYEENKVMADRVANAQVQGMDENNRQARDYYDYQTETFRPVEQGLVRDAEGFDTEANREQRASVAAADAGRAFTNTQGSLQRNLTSMGVNPNSGKMLALSNQNALGLSASRAGAMNNSRVQSEQLGWARRLDAAGLGRGLAGASTAAYQTAGGLGNSAVQNTMAPGNSALQGMNHASNTIMSGANNATTAAIGLLNMPNYQAQAGMAMGGALIGGASAAGSAYIGAKYAK